MKTNISFVYVSNQTIEFWRADDQRRVYATDFRTLIRLFPFVESGVLVCIDRWQDMHGNFGYTYEVIR